MGSEDLKDLCKMTKGTSSFGKRHNKTHCLCRRSGRRSFHKQKKVCASCSFPSKSMRRYQWSEKALRRRTDGTGRCKHLKKIYKRFKKNFREGGSGFRGPRPGANPN